MLEPGLAVKVSSLSKEAQELHRNGRRSGTSIQVKVTGLSTSQYHISDPTETKPNQ